MPKIKLAYILSIIMLNLIQLNLGWGTENYDLFCKYLILIINEYTNTISSILTIDINWCQFVCYG